MLFSLGVVRFDPIHHSVPRSIIWREVVMRSDVPDTQLTVPAIQMRPAVNYKARFDSMRLKGGTHEHYKEHCRRAVDIDPHRKWALSKSSIKIARNGAAALGLD